MKVKLLKKLRKMFPIERRGNEYRHICYFETKGVGNFGFTRWSKNKTNIIHSNWYVIIAYARKYYKYPKQIL